MKEVKDELAERINLFGDKAYADAHFKTELGALQYQNFDTDQEAQKGRTIKSRKHFNKTVSIHCLGKLTFELLLLNFYY